MTEQWLCINCWGQGPLRPDGRCGSCGSWAVVPADPHYPSPEWVYVYQAGRLGSVFGPLYQ